MQRSFEKERNGQFGTHVRNEFDVARILRHVRDEHRFAMQRGVADQPLAESDPRDVDFLAKLDRHFDLELTEVVEQEDAERSVVDEAAGQLRDSREQLLQVQHGGHFARRSPQVSRTLRRRDGCARIAVR